MTVQHIRVIAGIFLLLFMIPFVSADGAWFVKRIQGEIEYWKLLEESEQLGAIFYSNGVEELYLAVKLSDYNGTLFWIFPVPAQPDKVNISISYDFPQFGGMLYDEYLRSRLSEEFSNVMLTQIYPLFGILGGIASRSTMSVQIYQVVEKHGVHIEVLSARDSESLLSYLKSLNFAFPESSKEAFDYYIGRDYSFVLYYISNITPARTEYGTLFSVKTTFPAENLYFPLKLTSVYGEQSIPITVYVSGFVTPKVYSGLNASINYFVEDSGREYTRVEINTKAENLKDDLWILPEEPEFIKRAKTIGRLIKPLGMLIFLLLPLLSSLIAGRLLFGNWKKEYLLLGAFNYLTLMGFLIGSYIILKKSEKLDKYLLAPLFLFGLFVSWFGFMHFLSFVLFFPLLITFAIILHNDVEIGAFGIVFSALFLSFLTFIELILEAMMTL
nr:MULTISPECIES: DUF2330 domain-containing protein [unclassified Thermococcus]